METNRRLLGGAHTSFMAARRRFAYSAGLQSHAIPQSPTNLVGSTLQLLAHDIFERGEDSERRKADTLLARTHLRAPFHAPFSSPEGATSPTGAK